MATIDPQPAQNSVFDSGTTWWPNYTYPQVYTHPVYLPQTDDSYANDVEVKESEHDVTLVFSRQENGTRREVKRLTIPLSLWQSMRGDGK